MCSTYTFLLTYLLKYLLTRSLTHLLIHSYKHALAYLLLAYLFYLFNIQSSFSHVYNTQLDSPSVFSLPHHSKPNSFNSLFFSCTLKFSSNPPHLQIANRSFYNTATALRTVSILNFVSWRRYLLHHPSPSHRLSFTKTKNSYLPLLFSILVCTWPRLL